MRTPTTPTILQDIQHTARLHGNGFIQVDLCDNHRLHIFHHDLLPYGQKVRTIAHTHAFDMISAVLHGNLIHRHAGLVKGNRFEVYSCEYNGNRTVESTLQKDANYPGTWDFTVLNECMMPAGSRYYFKHGEWHESLHDGLTVTVIQKQMHGQNHTPLVACPVGKVPDNEYKRNSVPKEVLDKYFNMVYEAMDINKLIDKIILL